MKEEILGIFTDEELNKSSNPIYLKNSDYTYLRYNCKSNIEYKEKYKEYLLKRGRKVVVEYSSEKRMVSDWVWRRIKEESEELRKLRGGK